MQIRTLEDLYSELNIRSTDALFEDANIDLTDVELNLKDVYDYMVRNYDDEINEVISETLYTLLDTIVDANAISNQLYDEYGLDYERYVKQAGWDLSMMDMIADLEIIHDFIMREYVFSNYNTWKMSIVYDLASMLIRG